MQLVGCGAGDDVPESHISALPPPPNSHPVERYPERQALFGDLHVHTSWSTDAYLGGNRLGPSSAYRFARGEAVELQTGDVAQLHRPLDFVALTDHAENFGTHLECTLPDGKYFDTRRCRDMRSGAIDQQTMLEQAFAIAGKRPAPRDPETCADLEQCYAQERSTWQRVQAAANAFNDPGTFTTLIGYEFSSLIEEFGMLHRNVIFRGEDVVDRAISALDVKNQADFFTQLDAACAPPCQVLTIPHNTNYSWGLTFSRTNEDGAAYTADDLERRARLERLFEITQQKGNSECQLGVGAADEECDFELIFPACDEPGDRRCAAAASMFRNALLEGLTLGEEDGLNPYKMGTIGSTDTHLSNPGDTGSGIPAQFRPAALMSFTANRLFEAEHVVAGPIRRLSAGGLAGVWAEANTREDLFDAMRRRETFATSGSRLRVRFFAGDLPQDLGVRDDAVALAYQHGVPMGSDLIVEDAPRFWVWASQDPDGHRLDRIQIIKGWRAGGRNHQRVWDAVCAEGRIADDTGKCPPTSARLDLTTCAAADDAGASTLQTTFTDPDFDPSVPAFYYARVLENPSCRWTTVLANESGADLPADLPATTQQRGWSSPIWISSPSSSPL